MRTAFLLVLPLFALSACAEEDSNIGGGAGGTGAVDSGAGSGGVAGSAGGSGGSTGGSGGSAASAGSGGGDAGATITVTGKTMTLSDLSMPVTAFQVCVYDNPNVPCVNSDATGAFSIDDVPASSEVLLEFTKASYFPVLRTVTTGASLTDIGAAGYPTVTEASFVALSAQTSIDPAKGHVLLSAFQPGSSGLDGQDGVSATMTPDSGTGPIFVNDSIVPDATLTATSTAGFGLYANVDPGTVEVTMTHATKSCPRLELASFAGAGAQVSKVPVVAGYLTAGATVECM